MKPIAITASAFVDLVPNEGILVFDFWAGWCGPCAEIAEAPPISRRSAR